MAEHIDRPPVFDAATLSANVGTIRSVTLYDAATGERIELPVCDEPIEMVWDGLGVFRLDYGDGLSTTED